ncbi:hypothetical protein FRC02_012467 [Tulasnella sp. 418]|nr:hypothetical protein FRC02_012467 [Tulasnella sp. 418]
MLRDRLSVIAAAMNWSLEICDIIASTVYLATFCVFASQSDVLEAWGIKSRSRAVDAENQSTEYPGTEYNAASSRICGRKLRFFTPKRVAEPTNGGFTSNNPEVLRTLNQSDGELPLDSKPTSHFRVANNSTDQAEEPSKSDRLEITRSPFSFKGSHSSMRPRSTSGVSAISDGSSSSLDHRGPPKFSVTHLPPEPDKSKSIKEIDEDEDEEAMEFSPSHEWETGYTHSFESPIQTRISLHQAHNVWHNPS